MHQPAVWNRLASGSASTTRRHASCRPSASADSSAASVLVEYLETGCAADSATGTATSVWTAMASMSALRRHDEMRRAPERHTAEPRARHRDAHPALGLDRFADPADAQGAPGQVEPQAVDDDARRVHLALEVAAAELLCGNRQRMERQP